MMTATQVFWPQPFWPFPTYFAGMHQYESMQSDLADNLRRMAELNLEFARSMFDELRLDALGVIILQDPEELYAREIASELPLLGGPLRYVSAMMELMARAQQKWIDGWGHLLMRGQFADWTVGRDGVTDVPSWSIRETPRPQPSGE
ncbi:MULTISPECIES: phasin family protein [Cupriavidus]|uniref:phasin family protein n=1 Tax=Cupriavidus sp. DF5525 TaxID=3160989 RepID=UPI0003B04141|nr:hypothetical protein N234_33110 [Ralstonia pickettii DTP0602]